MVVISKFYSTSPTFDGSKIWHLTHNSDQIANLQNRSRVRSFVGRVWKKFILSKFKYRFHLQRKFIYILQIQNLFTRKKRNFALFHYIRETKAGKHPRHAIRLSVSACLFAILSVQYKHLVHVFQCQLRYHIARVSIGFIMDYSTRLQCID